MYTNTLTNPIYLKFQNAIMRRLNTSCYFNKFKIKVPIPSSKSLYCALWVSMDSLISDQKSMKFEIKHHIVTKLTSNIIFLAWFKLIGNLIKILVGI